MFRSRNKKNIIRALKQWLWPQKGYLRPWVYLRHRIVRLPDTPHRIAAGVASGVAASITPLIGFHFILGGVLAWLFRGNVIASAIGTAAGNPWTFPFIWLVTYNLGSKFLGVDADETTVQGLNIDTLLSNPGALLGPMMLGALPLAIMSWFGTYFLLKYMIAFYRSRRKRRENATLA